MGDDNFRPPTESTPLNRSPKICHRWLRRRPLQLCQIWCTSALGWLLGEWLKYNLNYFYLYPFLGTQLQVRCVDRFSRMMAQTTRTHVRVCLMGFVDIAPHLGVKSPKNPNFGGVNSRFQAKLVNSKNMHIIKTTVSIPTKFCTAIKTTKCPSLVVRTHT